MKINGFIWLEEIIDKFRWKHNLNLEEVEQIFDSKPIFLKMETGKIEGKDLYNALGRTESGRYISVFFIYKYTHQALIVTARDMNSKERKYYVKR